MQVILAQICLTLISTVWAQIEVAQDFDNSFYQQSIFTQAPPGVLDPSTFTSGMLHCHQRCGDGYYQCFLTCEDSQRDILPTKAFFDAKYRRKPNWNSYLLNVLTFGFMGKDVDIDKDEKVYYDSPYVGGENGMSDNLCLKNCTKLFRTCFRHCVCKVKDDPQQCMSDLISSSKQEIGDLETYTARIEYVTKNKHKQKTTDYKFDWDKVS